MIHRGVFPGNPLIFTHVLVLNIYNVNTEGRNVRLKLYICIGYMLPTIGGIYVSYIYVGIGHNQYLGDECKVGGFSAPDHYIFLKIHICIE